MTELAGIMANLLLPSKEFDSLRLNGFTLSIASNYLLLPVPTLKVILISLKEAETLQSIGVLR
jgi:hypothetical protein